jgi:hypothetical protein
MGGRTVRRVRFVAAEQEPATLAELAAQVSFAVAAGRRWTRRRRRREYLRRVLAIDAAARIGFDGEAEALPGDRAGQCAGFAADRHERGPVHPGARGDPGVRVAHGRRGRRGGAAGRGRRGGGDGDRCAAEPTIDAGAAAAAIARLAGVDPAALVIGGGAAARAVSGRRGQRRRAGSLAPGVALRRGCQRRRSRRGIATRGATGARRGTASRSSTIWSTRTTGRWCFTTARRRGRGRRRWAMPIALHGARRGGGGPGVLRAGDGRRVHADRPAAADADAGPARRRHRQEN